MVTTLSCNVGCYWTNLSKGTPELHLGAREPLFAFVDARRSSTVHDVEAGKKTLTASVVSNRHALAAHEYFHRRTAGFWAQHCHGAGLEAAKMSTEISGVSGLLVSLTCSEQGAVLLSIIFGNCLMELTVNFSVQEVSPMEFEVHVLEEGRRPLCEMGGLSDTSSTCDSMCLGAPDDLILLRQSRKRIAGTKLAVGRVGLTELLDGLAAASSRKLADRVFGGQ